MKGRVVSDTASDGGQSDTSVRTEADQFREAMDAMIAGPKSNEQLMTRAQDLIDSLGEKSDPNEFVPSWYKKCKTKVNRILGSMLACSYGCGGRKSQRYVSCAIIACTGGTKSSEDTHRALTELAISWFANFLWMFKAKSSYSAQGTTPIVSDQSTPSLTFTEMLHANAGRAEPLHRSSTMRDMVFDRDGRACPFTGLVDSSVETTLNQARLHCAHILKRAIAVFPSADSISDSDKIKHRFAMSTLDILTHFTTIKHEEVLEIVRNIDSPSNGIIMEANWHDSFDDFKVCLVPIPNDPNSYSVKNYKIGWPAGLRPISPQIRFTDHSNTGIELPRAEFIKLHTSLCEIFHMSGAGKDIDDIQKDLKKGNGGEGSLTDIFRSGISFLNHMELLDSLSDMLGSRLVLTH